MWAQCEKLSLTDQNRRPKPLSFAVVAKPKVAVAT